MFSSMLVAHDHLETYTELAELHNAAHAHNVSADRNLQNISKSTSVSFTFIDDKHITNSYCVSRKL